MSTAEYIQLTGFPVLPGRPGAPTGPGDPCIRINQVRYNSLFLLITGKMIVSFAAVFGDVTQRCVWGSVV